MTEAFSLGVEPIVCHAWNKDASNVAISRNSREIEVLTKNGKEWTVAHTLREHTDRILSVDWAKNSNRILSAGADRNAFVWTEEGGEWRPMLVVLRLSHAATCVKWSPNEDKFAVGSGARVIAICYHDKDQDFWVAKHIKKGIRSTITSLDWHPDNILVAAGCTDFKTRIFSGYVKEIEARPEATPWGKKMPFGNEMGCFSSNASGWVHAVAFSPSGNKLAWVGHDSSISVVDAVNDCHLTTVRTEQLPFLRCLWLTDSSIVTAGHDCCPMLFRHDAEKDVISFVEKLDIPKTNSTATTGAMNMFKTMDRKGTSEVNDSKVSTIHQNAVTGLGIVGESCAAIARVSTTGKDGQLVLWNLQTLEKSIAQLTIV